MPKNIEGNLKVIPQSRLIIKQEKNLRIEHSDSKAPKNSKATSQRRITQEVDNSQSRVEQAN